LVSRVTDPRVHASGHAHQGEQREMIELTRPRAFVPVHGTLHHLVRHAELARSAGVGDVVVVENGEVVELAEGRPLARVGRVPTGRVAAAHGDEVPEDVLRERAQLGRAGVVAVSVWLDGRGGLAGAPHVLARGVPSATERAASAAIGQAVREVLVRSRRVDDDIVFAARSAARRHFEAETGGRPVVLVHVGRKGGDSADAGRK
ncbi:MAG TPA: MBL fold metallo-hydrolase RNA specificity domain-containing protein, partial [Byssovorax sp.]